MNGLKLQIQESKAPTPAHRIFDAQTFSEHRGIFVAKDYRTTSSPPMSVPNPPYKVLEGEEVFRTFVRVKQSLFLQTLAADGRDARHRHSGSYCQISGRKGSLLSRYIDTLVGQRESISKCYRSNYFLRCCEHHCASYSHPQQPGNDNSLTNMKVVAPHLLDDANPCVGKTFSILVMSQ